ncbi:MAG TPA: hypothetical protein VGE90_04255 [Chitinophaga sp.]
MENKETNIHELSEKVIQGMKIALRRLVREKAKNNEQLVIGDKEGNITRVPAKDLLPSVEK